MITKRKTEEAFQRHSFGDMEMLLRFLVYINP